MMFLFLSWIGPHFLILFFFRMRFVTVQKSPGEVEFSKRLSQYAASAFLSIALTLFGWMTKSSHEELSFHRLQNNVYYRWISIHFSCKQNSKHKNAELSILAGEDLTPKKPLERERRLEIQRRKQQRWRRHQQIAEQREHHSMNLEC